MKLGESEIKSRRETQPTKAVESTISAEIGILKEVKEISFSKDKPFIFLSLQFSSHVILHKFFKLDKETSVIFGGKEIEVRLLH